MSLRILLYADPHLGLNRTANTTPASRAALRQRIADHVMDVLNEHEANYVICLGDFFDRYRNNEETINQAGPVFCRTDFILAGNHDISNYIKAPSTLGVLDNIYTQMSGKESKAIFPLPSREGIDPTLCVPLHMQSPDHPGIWFRAVPHQYSQESFERQLPGLVASGATPTLMHCNYDRDMGSDTALNLRRKDASWILNHPERQGNAPIILGHEHMPREDFDGRLIVLGNIHPTGFSDISDKRIAIVEIEDDWNDITKELISFHTVWRKSEGYAEHAYTDIPPVTTAQFVRITGKDVPRDQLSKVVSRAHTLWKESPSVLAMKIDVNAHDQDHPGRNTPIATTEDLPTLIDKELQGTSMYPLWRELVGD